MSETSIFRPMARLSTLSRWQFAFIAIVLLTCPPVLGSDLRTGQTHGSDTASKSRDIFVLHAAHAASTPDWWTRLTVLNRGISITPVLIELFDGTGVKLDTTTLPGLPMGGVYRADIDAIFGKSYAGSDLWLRVSGSSELCGAVEFGTRDDRTLSIVPLFDLPSTQIVFPYVYITPSTSESYYTGITVLNPNDAANEVILRAYTEDGALLAEHPETVPPDAKYVRLVDQIFDGVPDPNAIRMIRVGASLPVLGFELFGKWNAFGVAGLPAVVESTEAPILKSPDSGKDGFVPVGDIFYNEIPDNDTWYTGMTVCNLTGQTAQVLSLLFDGYGNTLREITWELGPYQQFTREVWNFFGVEPTPAAAAGRVKSNSAISGFELMLSRENPFRFDGLEACDRVYRRLDFPVIKAGADYSTHLHLSRIFTFPNHVTVTAYDAAGDALGTYTDVLSTAATLDLDLAVIFPDVAAQIAWIHVEAEDRVVGNVFLLSADNERLGSYLGIGSD